MTILQGSNMHKGYLFISYTFFALLLQGCEKEPSTHFKGMDRNADNAVTFVEWMGYYGTHQHPILNCSRSDFYEGDCNKDDKLTWNEYYQLRFKNRRCAALMPPYSEYRSKVESGGYSGGGASNSPDFSGSNVKKTETTNVYFQEYMKRLLQKEHALMDRYHIVFTPPAPQVKESSPEWSH